MCLGGCIGPCLCSLVLAGCGGWWAGLKGFGLCSFISCIACRLDLIMRTPPKSPCTRCTLDVAPGGVQKLSSPTFLFQEWCPGGWLKSNAMQSFRSQAAAWGLCILSSIVAGAGTMVLQATVLGDVGSSELSPRRSVGATPDRTARRRGSGLGVGLCLWRGVSQTRGCHPCLCCDRRLVFVWIWVGWQHAPYGVYC